MNTISNDHTMRTTDLDITDVADLDISQEKNLL